MYVCTDIQIACHKPTALKPTICIIDQYQCHKASMVTLGFQHHH